MKFTFTETPQQDGAYRFGGKLEIMAETLKDSAAIINHFKLYNDDDDVDTLIARSKALQTDNVIHTIEGEKRPVYEVNSCLGHDFLMPYIEWAKDNFGYDGQFPNLVIPRKYDGLLYIHYCEELYVQDGHICFKLYTTSEPWNGKDAQQYAEDSSIDYIGEEFGTRYQEPEFITTRSGNYKRNRNYLKRHKSTPSASNTRLKLVFFKWWKENHATKEQLAIIAGNEDIAKNADYMSAFRFKGYENNIYYGKIKSDDGKTSDYKSISFRDFAKLSEV